MDPTGNFYNYRTALRGAAHRSQTAHSNREKVADLYVRLLVVVLKYGDGVECWKAQRDLLFWCVPVSLRSWFLSSASSSRISTSWMRAVPIVCPMGMSTLRWGSQPELGNYAPVSFDSSSFGKIHVEPQGLSTEICGAGPPGGWVHGLEAGGVSIWGRAQHPTLPPHCTHLQRRWYVPVMHSDCMYVQCGIMVIWSKYCWLVLCGSSIVLCSWSIVFAQHIK